MFYDAFYQKEQRSMLLRQLNNEQKVVYDWLMAADSNDRPSNRPVFFKGPGGISKPTFYSCLISFLWVRAREFLRSCIRGLWPLSWMAAESSIPLSVCVRGTHTRVDVSGEITISENAKDLRSRAHYLKRGANVLKIWTNRHRQPPEGHNVVGSSLWKQAFMFGGPFKQIVPVITYWVRRNSECIISNDLWSTMWWFNLTWNMHTNDDWEFAVRLLRLSSGVIKGFREDDIRLLPRFMDRKPLADFIFLGIMSLQNLNN